MPASGFCLHCRPPLFLGPILENEESMPEPDPSIAKCSASMTAGSLHVMAPRVVANTEPCRYRQHRIAVLHAYCKCAKLRLPEGSTFIGIALDHPDKDYRGASEDLFVYLCEYLDEDAREEAERYRHELGILPDDRELKRMKSSEYPSFVTRADTRIDPEKRRREREEKTKRNRAKAAKASKRRNRRR